MGVIKTNFVNRFNVKNWYLGFYDTKDNYRTDSDKIVAQRYGGGRFATGQRFGQP